MNLTIKPANPQGKGAVAILDSLLQAKKQLVAPAKNIRQISSDLFTSLFVLNSQIRFKPTAGQTYWLYFKDAQYRLSLIAPEQWPQTQSGRFIGACELQSDLTWTLDLSDDCASDRGFIQEIASRRRQLEEKLQQAEKIDDVLPVYLETLPYYSRVLASALAYSLKQSLQKSGISGLSFRQAEKRLINSID
ncbi:MULTISPECIES: DUF2452 domain-containing protein [Methylomonas]|uniref:DUF2452 domain-containing protein n=2 Tax=Methylomonas TaxID=416 RepID=A0A126T2W0_9GAMM|nr:MULTISPECIES: DUF2452 domain-containing protein [Methylomonas]AMK76416.1 hypothetical protein JT25_007915 [Methylomonas denitrificans]OAH98675.1 hypothetical protein A1342_12655 [Methylomonas methanica]TCV88449.1 uncharacterized protein DUF2452 [Methylomonas methanica]